MNTHATIAKSILLVEDDARDVELTLEALAEQNMAERVAVVRDGAEAIDYLFRRGKFATRTSAQPVVVLLDNKMPKVSGLEVLKVIKTDPHLKTIPVVVLTSSQEMPDLIDFYEHGANGYVVKPMDCGEFMKAVNGLGVFWAGINTPPPASRGEADRRT